MCLVGTVSNSTAGHSLTGTDPPDTPTLCWTSCPSHSTDPPPAYTRRYSSLSTSPWRSRTTRRHMQHMPRRPPCRRTGPLDTHYTTATPACPRIGPPDTYPSTRMTDPTQCRTDPDHTACTPAHPQCQSTALPRTPRRSGSSTQARSSSQVVLYTVRCSSTTTSPLCCRTTALDTTCMRLHQRRCTVPRDTLPWATPGLYRCSTSRRDTPCTR